MRELRLLSVVAPMLDEEGLAREFCSRVASVLEEVPFELIVVDDGSTDGTAAILDEVAAAGRDDLPVAAAQRDVSPPAVLHEP